LPGISGSFNKGTKIGKRRETERIKGEESGMLDQKYE